RLGDVLVVLGEPPLGDLGVGEERLVGMAEGHLAAGGGDRVGHRSRTTSLAALSSRSPWKRGWRSRPAVVHSVKPISATSCGVTHVTPRSRIADGSAKGAGSALGARSG